MKLGYVLPGKVAGTHGGKEKMLNRLNMLKRMVYNTNEIDIFDISNGPLSIESLYDEYLSVPGTVKKIVDMEKQGFDAAILGCFGDPGLDAARELTNSMAVIGPGEASMVLAAMCGYKFSIITATDSLINVLQQLVVKYGFSHKLASIRSVNTCVLDLHRDMNHTFDTLIHQSRLAIHEDHADTIILGCMSLGFLNISVQLAQTLNTTVINPVEASVKLAETLCAQGITHSKLAYPYPPEI